MLDIIPLIQAHGHTGLFFITFLESLILFWLPGDSMIFMSGLMAAEGHFDLGVLILLFTTPSFLAGLGGYYIGRYLHVFHRYAFFRKLLHAAHIDRAKNFFERRGFWVVFIAKFFPLLRTFVPICIGLTSGMKLKTYTCYNLIGSVSAALTYIFAGYYLGRLFPWTQEYVSTAVVIIIILSILPVFKKLFRRRRTSSSHTSSD